MFQALFKSSRAFLCALSLCCGLSSAAVQKTDPPDIPALTMQTNEGGSLRAVLESEPIECPPGQKTETDLKGAKTLEIEAESQPGYVIERLEINDVPQRDAMQKASWKKIVPVETPMVIRARFEKEEIGRARADQADVEASQISDRSSGDASSSSSLASSSENESDRETEQKESDPSKDGANPEENEASPSASPAERRAAKPKASGLVVEGYRALSVRVGTATENNGLWLLSNGKWAFCGNWQNGMPLRGDSASAPVEVDNPALRKVLYYAYNGPANILIAKGYSEEAQIVITDDLVSEALGNGSFSHNIALEGSWIPVVSKLWEEIQAKPDPTFYKAYMVTVAGQYLNWNGHWMPKQPLLYGEGEPPKEPTHCWLWMEKGTTMPQITVSNSKRYSFAGAEFGVYQGLTPDESKRVGTLISQANGETNTLDLEEGWYCIKELKAPPNYQLSSEIRTVHLENGKTVKESGNDTYFQDTPDYFVPGLILKKQHSRTQSSTPSKSLAGAQFQIEYYRDVNVKVKPGKKPVPAYSWIYQTDSQGRLKMDDSHFVSGDEIFKTADGTHVLPVGCVLIREIKAPDGYFLNPEEKGIVLDDTAIDPFENPLIFEETPIDTILFKYDRQTNAPLAGVEFRLGKPDGTEEILKTDENGEIAFSYATDGTYTIQEVQPLQGYQAAANVLTVIVEGERVQIQGLEDGQRHENGRLSIPNDSGGAKLKIQKVDENNEPLRGAEFTLYGEDRQSVLQKKESGENGEIHFEIEADGLYYIAETKAPEGYRMKTDETGNPLLHAIRFARDSQGNLQITVDYKGESAWPEGWSLQKDENGLPVLKWTVSNAKQLLLPQSGSQEALLFSGMAVALCTVGLLMRTPAFKQREKKKNGKRRTNG